MGFVLYFIIFIVSVDGNGVFNLGETIGFFGIMVLFFITLNFILKTGRNENGTK